MSERVDTNRSEGSPSPTGSATPPLSPILQTLGIYHATNHLDLIVKDSTKTALYFVDNSFFTPGTPDVTIHGPPSPSKTSPTVAAARFTTFSSNFDVCLGDPLAAPLSQSQIEYGTVNKTSRIKHSEYEWSMELPVEGGAIERRVFLWKRTHGANTEHRWSWTNMKLVDKESGEILAMYLSNGLKSWKKNGKLQLMKDFGETWELMVIVTIMGIIEKERRRRRARNGHGGGGGE